MGHRGRALSEAMAKALADLTTNPDQTTKAVALKHGVSVHNFRLHVYQRELRYKRERRRGEQTPPNPVHDSIRLMLSPTEQKLLDTRKAELERERASAPVDARMRHQLGLRFEKLAALWGDWIKK